MPRIFASKTREISQREITNMNRSRALASQGMVLLKNGGSLPMAAGTKKIAAFGNGIRHTVKGGTGSGDVNSRFVVNLEQAMEEAGFTLTSKDWLTRLDNKIAEEQGAYQAKVAEAMKKDPMAGFMMVFNEPFKEPNAVAIEEADLVEADAAIYCIARNSGEGKDRTPERGDYLLTVEEEENIKKLSAKYGKVIVLLNIGGPLDTKFLRSTEGVDSVLLTSQAGNITGYAITDVITGKVTPSGHLTTTWAENYTDYPGADQFSFLNGDLDDEYYKEDIYVGYRYFDTFGVTPAYPFGYGLSYTTFSVEAEDVVLDGTKVSVSAKVTNTGSLYSGKEVVQVYTSAPAGKLEKPYQELAAYAKTKELAPKESQVLTMTFDLTRMASFDEVSASYFLEPGTYYVRVGNHSRNTKIAAALTLDRQVVTEQLTNVLKLDCQMETLSNKDAVPYTYEEEAAEKAVAKVIAIDPSAIFCIAHEYSTEEPEIKGTITDHVVTMDEVREGKATLDDLVAQLTVPEMADLCNGTARGGFGATSIIGAASACCPGAAGDTTSAMIESRNIRNMILADGPAGLRLSPSFKTDAEGNVIPGTEGMSLGAMSELMGLPAPVVPEDALTWYQYTTAIPIATLLAMSWDEALIEEAGSIVGGEMKEFGCTLWLAPGMNIHRNPLCGRNFEYYSEDPLVAGKCAAADTRGVQKHGGVGTTIKHFAFNNQEDNRNYVNSHVTERAAREIYLKGFEIAVKESQPLSIMSSYNLVNGLHTANCYDTITTCARQEWGFEGVLMTDWGTTGGMMGPSPATRYGDSDAAGCIAAGNDLVMPGSQKDVDRIIESVGAKEGEVSYPLTLGQLQACAKHILKVVQNCSAYED